MHGRGVAHRDVKPRNITVDPESGRVIIFDFSHATTLASLGSDRARFCEACAEDMRELDKHSMRAPAVLAAAKAATAASKAATAAVGGLLAIW